MGMKEGRTTVGVERASPSSSLRAEAARGRRGPGRAPYALAAGKGFLQPSDGKHALLHSALSLSAVVLDGRTGGQRSASLCSPGPMLWHSPAFLSFGTVSWPDFFPTPSLCSHSPPSRSPSPPKS
jgi:hypothetical protein